jgi:Mg-chelatase subunit ChlD
MTRILTNLGSPNVPALKREALSAVMSATERLMLIQDCSGSMTCALRDKTSRIDAAKTAIEHFITKCDSRISALGLIAFETSATLRAPMTTSYLTLSLATWSLQPDGTTYMGKALTLARETESLTRAILISDGEPVDPNCVETEVLQFIERKIPIDTIFVGDAEGAGAALMRSIAERTGGFFTAVNDSKAYAEALTRLEFRNRLQLEHKQR